MTEEAFQFQVENIVWESRPWYINRNRRIVYSSTVTRCIHGRTLTAARGWGEPYCATCDFEVSVIKRDGG